MLKSLYVSSFIIIDELRIDFDNGLSVMTGETGAGKSIIIDALGQLCGNRSSASFIKKNASKAIIEGIFDVDMHPKIQEVCQMLHIEPDEEFVITKEIHDSGKSNIKINYQNASNQSLKLLMPFLIDIHSQFETQKLFEEKNHRVILDEFAHKDIHVLKKEYTESYQDYRHLVQKLNKVQNEDLSDEQLDFLQSQLNEIDQVSYTDEQVEELENELTLLQNFEKINENIQEFHRLMDAPNGALPMIKESLNYLDSINEVEDFKKAYDNMYNYYYHLIDECESVMDTFHSFQFDQYRFNELQETLYIVNKLKRKYGYTMASIQEQRETIAEHIDNINNRETYIQDLQKQIDNAREKAYHIAKQISAVRVDYARRFETHIHEELKDLYLDKASFCVAFSENELQKDGIDKVSFMISTNKGQSLSLLNESASGGEVSRIMLAIKTIILKFNPVDTIVFDEVDTGVSGKVASSIGEKMYELAKQKQVICITHLPQVACLGQHHYCIEKEAQDHDTVTYVTRLDQENRIHEIAKMLSGEKMTLEAIENAKKLLNI